MKKQEQIDIVRKMIADGVVTQEQAAKYFPELAEGEGERTWIINYLSNRILNSTIIAEKENLKKAIAWFERQGETFTKKYVDDAYLKGISDAKTELEKQGEQSPIDVRTIGYWHVEDVEQKPAETEKGAKGNEREIPNSAWSEEDEEISKAIIKRISGESDALSVSLSSAISWVENVKDRVQPQPKQEWSKEDEKMTKNLTSELYNLEARKLIDKETKDKYTKWLKSLIPQSTWKLSDEQIMALRWVLNHIPYSSHKEEINGLLEQYLKGYKNI